MKRTTLTLLASFFLLGALAQEKPPVAPGKLAVEKAPTVNVPRPKPPALLGPVHVLEIDGVKITVSAKTQFSPQDLRRWLRRASVRPW